MKNLKKSIFSTRTPKIKSKGKIISDSITEIKKVKIGGVEQAILIRGHNKNNPVILFLHGGPGQSEIGYIRQYQEKLEEKFVVVRWDQRGSGASFSKDIPQETFTIEQFYKDTDEITDYLREEFNQSKIYICGHSWGTVLGTLAVKNNPEKYLAYIGVAQMVNIKQNENISYDFALRKAKEANDKKAIKNLESMKVTHTYKNILRYRKYVEKFGGVITTKPKKGIGLLLLMSTEYKLFDKLNYLQRLLYSGKLMHSQIININFMQDIKELQVPTYFIIGKNDFTTAYPLVEKFYKQLKAPKKELIVFKNSAHLPQLEENEKFNNTIIRIMENL
ncbi:alpha/beta hydrolase [Clostridium sp. 'deep sea']|uniref:alpha/beta fold hydrolase n=1 Tax=Clostridium sp. 'deep sea' TaxID=2779445 RepID=UPI00189651FF|nr:alpha/beta hydrolase [Clostridium sp. 'deep sea']QOR34233.1 alpha/beta hydrolase [Clostridium sp. 'deep sea']